MRSLTRRAPSCLQKCALCHVKGVGATIKCEDCPKHFHVSCAWTRGCKFAFEVQHVRNKKRPPKDAVIIKFKDEEGASLSFVSSSSCNPRVGPHADCRFVGRLAGVLQPCVWCTEHHFTHQERKTYDLGARDQASKLVRPSSSSPSHSLHKVKS